MTHQSTFQELLQTRLDPFGYVYICLYVTCLQYLNPFKRCCSGILLQAECLLSVPPTGTKQRWLMSSDRVNKSFTSQSTPTVAFRLKYFSSKSSDNLLSYPPDSYHSSDAVYWREMGKCHLTLQHNNFNFILYHSFVQITNIILLSIAVGR